MRKFGLQSRKSRICAALLVAAVLSGCGGKSASSERMMTMTRAETVAAAGAVAEELGYAEVEAVDVTAGNGAYTGLGGTEIQASTETARKLIRTIDLQVETQEFDALVEQMENQIAELGGYIESSSISGKRMSEDGRSRSASLTARIPNQKLDAFVSEVSEQGNVTRKSETTEDVTLQYTDVESRKKALETEQERLWVILEKADTLESVIALEERLSEIRYQLESYESRLRLYDNQVDYGTVNLSVSEVRVLTTVESDGIGTRIQKGFRQNATNLYEFVVDLVVWFVASLPILVPLGIVAVVLGGLLRKWLRKERAEAAKRKASELKTAFSEKKEKRENEQQEKNQKETAKKVEK